MTLEEMINMINSNVDDVVLNEDALMWLNAGQNKMAVAVGANFPRLEITPSMDATFVFPEKYHDLPVLYASAMYKAQDTSLSEKDSFMVQFIDGLKDFVARYTPPIIYRDDETTEQFDIQNGMTSELFITKNSYDPRTGKLKVYVNGIQTNNFIKDSKGRKSFLVLDDLVEGDRVTAQWEIHTDMQKPPYSWWSW